jgi:glycosyltransferase involved in cell wall biosynthesis
MVAKFMMQASCTSTKPVAEEVNSLEQVVPASGTDIKVGLLTGCRDKPYVFGLVTSLLSKGIWLDLIGSEDLDSPEFHETPKLNFLNLGGRQGRNDKLTAKLFRLISYYVQLIPYTMVAKPKIFHILWNYKLEHFDRTLLTLFYKLAGKKIVLTLHNVNAGIRDSNDSLLNRLTLKFQYRLADHVFVHTNKMKHELCEGFGVAEQAVTVIPFGINNSVPTTDITPQQARRRLGIKEGAKTILFFGNIGPYKGLEFLVAAFQRIAARNPDFQLIIAGKTRGGSEKYLADIQSVIDSDPHRAQITRRIEFIPDEETELYFKAADVFVLPYTQVFQSGVLFLGYSFGLPVIATEVGSLSEDILEGRTGFLCKPADPDDLAKALEVYFASNLFKDLDGRRQEIRDFANERHSWDVVGEMTRNVYASLLRSNRS